MSLEDLNGQLDALEADLPAMIEQNPDPAAFWAALTDRTDPIEQGAGEHGPWVLQRLANMLALHGRYIAAMDIE